MFAMKEMDKARVLSKKSEKSIMNEKRILSTLQHKFPFQTNLMINFK